MHYTALLQFLHQQLQWYITEVMQQSRFGSRLLLVSQSFFLIACCSYAIASGGPKQVTPLLLVVMYTKWMSSFHASDVTWRVALVFGDVKKRLCRGSQVSSCGTSQRRDQASACWRNQHGFPSCMVHAVPKAFVNKRVFSFSSDPSRRFCYAYAQTDVLLFI